MLIFSSWELMDTLVFESSSWEGQPRACYRGRRFRFSSPTDRAPDPWASATKQGGQLIIEPVILNLAAALGIGLLIGAERERRKGEGPSRSPAGIRTFTVASLAGAISFIAGGEVLLAVATAGVI